MNTHWPIDIRQYLVSLPSNLDTHHGKQGIQVRRGTLASAGDPKWRPITALGDDFFRPAFDRRNALNIPGPFYGAETDT